MNYFRSNVPKILTVIRTNIKNSTLPPKELITSEAMELPEIVKKLNNFAPLTLAGSWDNVGLLVEPTPPHHVAKMLLTNDLTEDVMSEALDVKANMILSYHPPIFSAMKCLTQRTWKERIVIKCIENRIAIYSPHTAFDAVVGGVNDWLLKPFEGCSEVLEQVDSKCFTTPGGYRFEVSVSGEVENVQKDILKINGVTLMNSCRFEVNEAPTTRLTFNTTQKALPKVFAYAQGKEELIPTVEIISLKKPPVSGHGPGRLMKLKTPVSLTEAISRVKSHLQLSHLRVAYAVGVDKDKPIKKIAVCAGSGASVLRGVDAHLYITGEMSHHEVLDANHRGIHVILCEHSNTERGYLKELQKKLDEIFEARVELVISKKDADPLNIV